MADGDLHLSESPNVDTGLVEKDGSLHRAVLTAVPEGTLQLSDSANVSTGYVTDSDGKKHKVNLVAEVEGSLELSDNPSADTGYVTDGDGKKHKVKLTASLHGGGGSTPVIDELNVTPSTSAQVITAPEGTDGYSPVNVSAVTSSIDANIAAGNIKSGVTILGVSGNVVELNGTTTSVTPTTSAQTITPTAPVNGFTEVNVNAVTSAIDANITAGNIKKDVQILGVTGSYEGVAPSGTKPITTNGIHDVAGYANADVQVPTTAPTHYIEKTVDANGKLINSTNIINLTGVTDVGDYILYYAYYKNTSISGVIDYADLRSVSGQHAFANAFSECSNITSVNLSNLINVSGMSAFSAAFTSCSGITSINFSKLVSLESMNAFSNIFRFCTGITTVTFDSLSVVTGSGCLTLAFGNIPNLSSMYFPAIKTTSFGNDIKNQFSNMCLGALNVTLHFPSNVQSVIETLSGYSTTAPFGATAGTVLFDLPATE